LHLGIGLTPCNRPMKAQSPRAKSFSRIQPTAGAICILIRETRSQPATKKNGKTYSSIIQIMVNCLPLLCIFLLKSQHGVNTKTSSRLLTNYYIIEQAHRTVPYFRRGSLTFFPMLMSSLPMSWTISTVHGKAWRGTKTVRSMLELTGLYFS
jgi:hypothetical protein